MSGDVRLQTQMHQNQLNQLKKKNEKEIEFVKKSHEIRVDESKRDHELELTNLNAKHEKEIFKEIDRKEKALNDMRKSLDHTQKMTEAEKERLISHSQARTQTILNEHQDRLATLTEKNEAQIQQINEKFNQKMSEIGENSQFKLKSEEEMSQHKLLDQKERFSSQIDNQRENYQHTLKHERERFENLLEKTKKSGQKQLTHTEQQNQKKLAKATENFVESEKKVVTTQQQAALDREHLFEKKYQNQLAKFNQDETNLKGLHEKFVLSEKEKVNARVELEREKARDDFYKFTELKPTIIEQTDGYEIRVKIPEYAKEEVMLSTNQKELVLTANRRHQDQRKDESGVERKISRVESLVSRIPVDSILNPRKMTKQWVEGELIFKVYKA
jgi:HSP20 family molecular chaperone IbpA